MTKTDPDRLTAKKLGLTVGHNPFKPRGGWYVLQNGSPVEGPFGSEEAAVFNVGHYAKRQEHKRLVGLHGQCGQLVDLGRATSVCREPNAPGEKMCARHVAGARRSKAIEDKRRREADERRAEFDESNVRARALSERLGLQVTALSSTHATVSLADLEALGDRIGAPKL